MRYFWGAGGEMKILETQRIFSVNFQWVHILTVQLRWKEHSSVSERPFKTITRVISNNIPVEITLQYPANLPQLPFCLRSRCNKTFTVFLPPYQHLVSKTTTNVGLNCGTRVQSVSAFFWCIRLLNLFRFEIFVSCLVDN